MIVDDTHVEYFNNQLYVHICTYKYRGELIYYFSNLYNQLFCTKVNGVYQVITDNYKYWLYKNVFGLVNPLGKNKLAEVRSNNSVREKINHISRVISMGIEGARKYEREHYRLPPEEEAKYRAELIESIKEIEEKFGLSIDLEEFQQKVNKLKYEHMPDDNIPTGVAIPSINTIRLKDIAREDTNLGREVRRHEGIHIKTNNHRLYALSNCLGLLEGETENLNQDSFGNIGSFSYSQLTEEKKIQHQIINLHYNTSYSKIVCLVKQMEVALGKKSYDSILKGDMSFERDFIKQYGLIPFIKLASATNILKDMSLSKGDTELAEMKLLAKTQNDLLKTVFNKDFTKVQTPQDAVEFLRKLRSFDLVRMRDFITNDDKQPVEDPTYQNYYIEMYSKVQQVLMNLGYSKEQIDQNLEGLEYKKQRFNPVRMDLETNARSFAGTCLFMNELGAQVNPEECTFFKASDLNGHTINVIIRKGKILNTNAIPIEGQDAFKLVVEEKDLETEVKSMTEQGYAFSKIDVDPKVVRGKMEEIAAEKLKREQEWKEKQAAEQQRKLEEKDQQEQALAPYKRNIFQKLFDRIKETFNRKKDDKETQPALAESERKKEEKRPSWDLRNWGMTKESLQKKTPTQTQEQARNIENQRNVTQRTNDNGPEL